MTILFFFCSFFVWLIVIITHYLKTKKIKIHHFRFSERNYYVMFLGGVFSLFINCFITRSVFPLISFLIFGVAGVIGETVAALLWHSFFKKRFWVYKVDTLFHSYTSFLNFIPYAFGGMLYITIANFVIPARLKNVVFSPENLFIPVALLSIGLLSQTFIFYRFLKHKKTGYKFHKVTILNYFFLVFPWIVPIIYLIMFFGPPFIFLTVLFGIIPTIAEYIFGKATQFFISKKMWIYTYASYDHGHFTPLAIPGFILGGYYFLIIDVLLKNFL